jgi:hypothetical protein
VQSNKVVEVVEVVKLEVMVVVVVDIPSPRISAAYRPNCPSKGNSAVMPQLACWTAPGRARST